MDAIDMVGNRYSWKQIVDMFPDQWVALSDYNTYGGEPTDGVLQAVCKEDEISKNAIRLKNEGKYVYWKRTTELKGLNVLWEN